MRAFILAGLASGLLPMSAHAESEIAVNSAVYVERATPLHGAMVRTIEPASILAPGQRVVLMLAWHAPRGGDKFTVTAPVPPSLTFERSSTGTEQVSVDGGRSWGRIGTLRLRDAYGMRLATPEDVTHVRWRMSSVRSQGRITYSAVVR